MRLVLQRVREAGVTVARELYARVVALAGELLPGRVASGVFGADMDVALVNQGPVTILLDSATFTTPPPLDGA